MEVDGYTFAINVGVIEIGEASAIAREECCVATMGDRNVGGVGWVGADLETRIVETLVLKRAVKLELMVWCNNFSLTFVLIGKDTVLQ